MIRRQLVTVAGSLLLLTAVAACATEADEDTLRTRGGGTTTTEREGRTTTTERPRRTTTTTERGTTTTTERERTTTTQRRSPEGVEITVVDVGFSILDPGYDGPPQISAAAALEHDGDEMITAVEVVFNFLDADGRPVVTETSYLGAMDPGQTAYITLLWAEVRGDREVATVEVVPSYRPGSSYGGPVIPLTLLGIEEDRYSGTLVNGTARNDTDERVEYGSVDCALLRGGEIVGGARTHLDSIAPGSEIAWEASSYLSVPGVDSARCTASAG